MALLFLVLMALSLLMGKAPAQSTFVNTTFVITDDQTTYDPDQIWVTLAGTFTDSYAPQLVGTTTLSSDQLASHFESFNLTALTAPVVQSTYQVSGTTLTGSTVTPVSYFSSNQYTLSLNDFSGRIYVNYGPTAITEAPNPGSPGNSPYIVFEPTVTGLTLGGTAVTTSNMDLSYVDGISASAATNLRNATTGASLAATTFNPITTPSDIVAKVAALVPSAAVVNTGGVERVISSAAAAPGIYHTWDSLENTLQTNNTVLNVDSYTSPLTGGPPELVNALFGYAGAPALTGTLVQPPGFETAQSYTSTAQFVGDLETGLTPTQISNLATAGLTLTGTTSGVVIDATGGSVGAFKILITTTALNAGTGIYGNNPGSYVLIGNTAYNYAAAGITNDLTGRIVGDLTAGIVFGWSNSTVNIAAQALATGTNLYGTTWSSSTIGGLSTGEYFYLLSLAAQQGKLSDWIGGNADSNPQDYDAYLAAVSEYTSAYSSGFTDRLQGLGAPGTFWYTDNPPTNPFDPPNPFEDVGFVDLTIGDVDPVPEPSQYGLGLALALAGLIAWRRFSIRVSQGNHSA